MPDLKAIRVFLEVAAGLSFAGASKALNMTPASVTRIVARLEKDMGQQLLLRTTRQVSLTSAGAVVAARYRPLVEEFDRISSELSQSGGAHKGRLTINAPMSFGQRLMPGLVENFTQAYPNIELSVFQTDRLVDIVDERCDLAIRVSAPPSDKSTIWRKICKVPRITVASPDWLDRHAGLNQPEHLTARDCMSYGEAGLSENWIFTRGSRQKTIAAGTHIVSNNGDFLRALAVRGLGAALLPEFIVARDIKHGQLQRLLPDWTPSPLWLSLFYPPYNRLPPLVSTFSDFFEAYLSDLDGFEF